MSDADPLSHHILMVEDDPSLADWIVDYLTTNGYLVTLANRGDEAIRMIREDMPDLLLLDVNLPVVSGFDICREVRSFYSNPILMVTARGEEIDEVTGLEVGADDYLIKPVRPRALLARLQRLLGQGDSQQPSQYQYGRFCINQESRSTVVGEERIELSSTEFDLLWLLASQAGNTLSRDDIVSQLRGIEYDGFDRSVDILVSRIRKKLGDHASKPFKIKTVRGKGYLFAPDAWQD
ncbi:MAG: response regulator transcription factor [Gammaproteobacteria bacterium]|nr:response regulator transcription factor [Gammaproteobacteria bacterium]